MQNLLGIVTAAHVSLGAVAVIAGALALAAPKGRPVHIAAGRTFLISMACSAALGALLGLVKAESLYITFHAGVLALTLIASGWLAAAGRDARPSRAMITVGLVNLANTVGLILAGWQAQAAPTGQLLGYPAEDYYLLAGMAGLAAIWDASRAFRTTFPARHRIASHLWRMGLGFFIAAGSAFTGPGASAFPEDVRQSGVLALPELAILALILFWLAFTLLRRGPKTERSAR